MKASELDQLRDAIDTVDRELLKLLEQRLGLVLRVGELKQEHGVKVYDAERERAVLDRLASLAAPPMSNEVARRIFERIIDECRSQEKHHIDEV